MSDFAVFDAGWRAWYSGDVSCHSLHGYRPYDYVEIEIWRDGWAASQLVDPCEMAPEICIFGLWWRAAGPLRKGRKRKT